MKLSGTDLLYIVRGLAGIAVNTINIMLVLFIFVAVPYHAYIQTVQLHFDGNVAGMALKL